jgi:hypothetical protein
MELDEFLCKSNIEHYRRLANTSTDAAERQVILELLAEEMDKLKIVRHGRAEKVGQGQATHEPS